MEAFNPDNLSFVGKTNQGAGAGVAAGPKEFNPVPQAKKISEVQALDENSIVDISGTPDELPPMEVPAAGTYDCSIDSLKYGTSKTGNFKLVFVFKILNPGFEGKFIPWTIIPGTDFGLIRYNQIMSRSLKTDPQTGNLYPVIEKANKVSFKMICDSGMAVGARVRLTGKPKTSTWEGENRTNFNVTAVSTPKTNAFI